MTVEEALQAAKEQMDQAPDPVNDILTIDPETRMITVPASEILLGVQHDAMAERKYFRSPKIVGDDIDLTKMELYVVFQNAGGTEDRNRDRYHVTDVQTVDDGYIEFSWKLSEKVTAYAGDVQFGVCAIDTDEDGNVVNRWNTGITTGKSMVGLDAGLTDYERDSPTDLYTQLITELTQTVSQVTPITVHAVLGSENVVTSDKSFSEITGLIQTGKNVLLRLRTEVQSYTLNLSEVSSSQISFRLLSVSGKNVQQMDCAFRNDGSIVYTDKTLEIADKQEIVTEVTEAQYSEQNLTDQQQTVARKNISAAKITYDAATKTLNILSGGVNSGDVEKITLDGNVIDLAAYALRDTLSCDMLGLQADDAAGTNAALLSAAINSGFKVLVDKMYTIKADAPAQISRDIVVIGKDESCGFNFAASTQNYLFGLTSSVRKINVENLALQNTTGDVYSLFWNTSSGDNDLDLDELSVSGCSFHDVSLIRVSGNRLYNDSDTLSRCDRFEFVNNKVENARFSYCQMDDVLFKTAEIRNNTVHNFKWTLFSFSITNMPDSGTPHDLQKFNALNDQRNRILIENNYIYCDDDYIIDINASSTYYTAFLLECDSCEYRSNHVEGMKASANIAVYDAYLSCNKVISEGNVWKNNVCFNASKNPASNTLMKAKGGSGIRRFAGNKYIVTTEYVNMLASTYGANLDKCWVRFADSVTAQQWEIVDNVIDCYYLGMYTSNMQATQWTITGNNISCTRLSDNIVPGNVKEKCIVNFKGNIISASGQSEFKLTTEQSSYIEYNVVDNVIDAPLSTITGMMGTIQANGKERFDGNRIICNYARYQIAFGENDITAPKIANMGNFWGNMQMNLYLKGETKAETVADFDLPDDNFAARIRIIAMATGTTDIINKDYLVAIKKADIGTTAKIYDLLTNTVAYDGLLRPTDASAWIEFGNGAARAYIAMLKSTSSNKSHIGIESKAGVEAKISITTEVIDTLVV